MANVIITEAISAPRKSFWDTINLWNTNSHYINRRLIGSKLLFSAKIEFHVENDNLIEFVKNLPAIFLVDKKNKNFLQDYFNNIHNIRSINKIDFEENVDNGIIICIFILLPKKISLEQQIQLCLLDKTNDNVYYKLLSETNSALLLAPKFIYGIKYTNSRLELWCNNTNSDTDEKTVQWIKTKVFPKLIKWILEAETFDTPISKSLSLVSVEEYCVLYQELKQKYAAKIIKIWPENTDPLKFVFEDVAISTYLILIWKQERKEKNMARMQTFIDLGCGNGLLVYILNQEGYKGEGIDIRSRRIWSLYPPEINLEISKPAPIKNEEERIKKTLHLRNLKVTAITPSDKFLFPNFDWLIGNHSDELTPWIPVIAARSSKLCQFFLLPCCPYDFNGQKYQRVDSSKSQYAEYLHYIQKISEVCGFSTTKDKLRIPSTKRICLIGSKTLTSNLHVRDDVIQQFIDSRCNVAAEKGGIWAQDFVVRSAVEKVRNCTKVDKNIVNEIIKKVTGMLLSKTNYIENEFGKEWNQGGKLKIKEIIENITAEQLKALKNECGGLQTLLKNHHYIFQVYEGIVQFRIPSNSSNNKNAKRTQCWFQMNHPNGCPLYDENCRYKHM